MERWANSSLGKSVHFLMVCVDVPQAEVVARKYVNELGLNGVCIGFCKDESDFPHFRAQLGCQGLIIFDKNSKIVVRRTAALNEVGVQAFVSTDAIITSLLEDDDDQNSAYTADASTRIYRDIDFLRSDLRYRISCSLETIQQKQQSRLGSVPSVGNAEMDAEHDACSLLFDRLARERTPKVLAELVQALATHFEHEEQLLIAAGFGQNAPEGFSPLISHTKDHTRIITAARTALALTLKNGVPLDCAQNLAHLFEQHAIQFDTHYSDYLIAYAGRQS
uniref:Hemerythrin-like domain-containing protein n=1 Tax=Aureoumbra lagunensis TaxID=44058 RepID=A0A7S3JS63_9STRA|mmetsp:Transcript_23202/g.30028  ORF Transcript_23202/g.30028 Transcript_23202/m.30028 type:complete len:278 (-) Transcript_23202:152-985(-)